MFYLHIFIEDASQIRIILVVKLITVGCLVEFLCGFHFKPNLTKLNIGAGSWSQMNSGCDNGRKLLETWPHTVLMTGGYIPSQYTFPRLMKGRT